MRFSIREHQSIIRDFELSHLRCNVWAGMGTGKTSSTYAALSTMQLFGEAKRVLVCAPKRVAAYTWPSEAHQWDDFKHITVAPAIGSPKQRIDAILKGAFITTINYENLPWLIETLGEHWPFDTVVADEATRLKSMRVSLRTSKTGKEYLVGQGSVRAKAIANVAHKKVRRWINLTGSPAPNGLQDVWGQQWFVDAGRRLGVSYTSFEDRFFTKFPNSNGYGASVRPLDFAKPEIERMLGDCTITIRAEDWFDIQKPVEHVVKIQLPQKARQIYEDVERKLFAALESGDNLEVFNAAGIGSKCLQIASGAPWVDRDEDKWEEVHDEKLEALSSVVEETNGEPILLRYCNVPDKMRVLKRFPKAKFLDNNPQTIEDWNKGRLPMLVTHAASAGHGLSLQHGGRILCDFSQNFNLEEDEQIFERIGPTRQAQSGYNRVAYRYRLVAEDTIEENAVLPCLQRKMTMQESLKNAMRVAKSR